MIKREIIMNKTWKLVVLLIIMIALTGCMAGNSPQFNTQPAGFFYGIWHGWLAPLSLLLKFFNPEYSIFEVNNTGLGYELGFYMAIISGFGGLSLARKKRK
jgi:hypothetical protein